MKKEFWKIFIMQMVFVFALWLIGVCSYAWAAITEPEINFDNFYDVDGAVAPVCPPTGSTGCEQFQNFVLVSQSQYTKYYRMSLFFTSNDAATAYRNTLSGYSSFSASLSLTGWNPYLKVQQYGYDQTGWIEIHYQIVFWVNTGGATYYEEILPPDQDEDGLSDGIDPWPDDDQSFVWKRFAYCRNASDEIVAFTIRAQRADGESIFKTYGDPDSCTQADELDLFSSTHNGSALASYFETGGEYASFDADDEPFEGLTLEYGPGTGDGFASGSDDSGNSTDSERLSDIVNNTKSSADNVARLGDYLQGIGESIEGLNETITGSSGGVPVVGGSSEGGISSDDIETGVDSAIQDAEGRADDELSDGLSGLPGSYDFSDEGTITGQEDEFGAMNTKIGDADSNGVSDGIDSIRNSIGSNNLVDALQNSGVQLSGAECLLTMDTVIFGDVDLNFCQWASAFDTIGNYTVALSWMVFMMIVFL